VPHIESFLAEPLKELKETRGGIVSTIIDTYPSARARSATMGVAINCGAVEGSE
jgi:hypothetical protein